MGREWRIEPPGEIVHAGTRGNGKQTVFFDDVDRITFLRLLAKAARRHGWTILGFCLMSNHYHLVLRIGEGGFSAGMQLLNGGYARQTNRRYDRFDHLFRNRFWSELIGGDAHLLEAVRYVDLNPVRAGIHARPEDWPWSSYRALAGLDVAPSFLATSEILGMFSNDLHEATRAYRTFVANGHVRVSGTVTGV